MLALAALPIFDCSAKDLNLRPPANYKFAHALATNDTLCRLLNASRPPCAFAFCKMLLRVVGSNLTGAQKNTDLLVGVFLKKTVMNDTTHDLCTQTAFFVAHLSIKNAHPKKVCNFRENELHTLKNRAKAILKLRRSIFDYHFGQIFYHAFAENKFCRRVISKIVNHNYSPYHLFSDKT